jgi:crotonobetainyl-CoA:carnitine CoA-transferase CaiB-like acyl-CoA transferase
MADRGNTDTEQLLAGVRVLDFCRDLSGPYTSMMLAELGADVVEVEHPVTGDESRSWPPRLDGIGGYFATINRSKRSLALDLKHLDAVPVALDLAARADVVMQSFTPGTADRLGIGYAAVQAVNPTVVYYSLSGYGQDGPWRTRRGYDPILQAMSGHMSVMGEAGRGPVKSMIPVADIASAAYGTASILGALYRREHTGKGQHIDMAMLDVMVSMLTVVASRHFLTGEIPERQGTENPQRVPSAAFECADGRYLQVVPNQRQWPAFCRVLGRPDWTDDARFATPTTRVENSEVLLGEVRAAFRTKTAADWEDELTEATVACSPINNLAEVFALDQVKHRGLVQSFEVDGVGEVPALALPFRYSETPAHIRRRPPMLGEHSVEVLEELGLSADAIGHLLAGGAIRQRGVEGAAA